NYDRLVDSPVEMGTFRETDFDESGAHFRVVIDADPADYNADQIKDSLHKIVAAAIDWMKDRPFQEYIFFYHFPRGPAGGGMEHAYSTAIDLNAASIKQNLYALESVTSHEFFHLWNVKRIRPRSLEPVDYNKGELLGVLLDLTVREQSHGQASLRDILQWMNRNYAQKGQFFDDSRGVRDAAEAVSHADLASFFQKYVAGTEEIPWNDFFR